MGVLKNTGVNFTVEAAEAITAGDAVALDSTTGKAKKANAATGGNQQVPCVGIAETSVSAGEYVTVLRAGKVGGYSNLTPGAPVYLGETDGAVTATAPSDSGDYVQTLGQAVSSTEFIINIESVGSTVA